MLKKTGEAKIRMRIYRINGEEDIRDREGWKDVSREMRKRKEREL
jgi:hypothetical protein